MKYFQVKAMQYLTAGLGHNDIPPGKINSDWNEWLQFYSFPQRWPSTALGFGGMGGSRITLAQTNIIKTVGLGQQQGIVFYNRKPAYICDVNNAFSNDLKSHNIASLSDAKIHYNNVTKLQ